MNFRDSLTGLYSSVTVVQRGEFDRGSEFLKLKFELRVLFWTLLLMLRLTSCPTASLRCPTHAGSNLGMYVADFAGSVLRRA